MKYFKYLALFLICMSDLQSNTPINTNHTVLNDIDKQLAVQQQLAKSRNNILFKSIDNAKSEDEKQAIRFILAYSPLSDLADYSGDFFLSNIQYTLKAKKELEWVSKIPEDIFLHFVLPVRVNNENIDSFRIVMYNELSNRVKGMPMYKAALEVNHWCHEKATYRGADARTSSPLATVKYSFGRCGEESTLLVAALRTVGIPARQVYTPRWAHSDDNHAWVEVWVDGKWYFIGACEPNPELNMGWFAEPSTRTMLVNTRAFGAYYGSEETIVRSDRFAELNLIQNYTDTKRINIEVIEENGKPVQDAKVEYQLYNYAEFFTLAKSITDKFGKSNFLTGKGDLIIWASKDGKYGFAELDKNDTAITVRISNNPKLPHLEFDLTPPKGRKPIEVNPINARENEIRLLKEDSIRAEYMKTFLDSNEAEIELKKLKITDSRAVELLVKAYGNWDEIIDFLKSVKPSEMEAAIDLLSVISEKDLRDTRAYILHNHLQGALPYLNDYKNNREIWKEYVLSGRIEIEMMNDWREIGKNVLSSWNDNQDKPLINTLNSFKFEDKISKILEMIAKIKIDTIANTHSRAPITPKGVFELQVADPKSRDIFFVALCRSLGIASRLNSATSIPQYWSNGKWTDVSFEAKKASSQYGFVHFNNKSSFDAKYYSNFTIRRLVGANYQTLEFDDIIPISKFEDKIEVPSGKYMIVTGNRKTDGEVLATIDFFDVQENNLTNVDVKVRDLPKTINSWAEIELGNYRVNDITNNNTKVLSDFTHNKPFIIAIIEPDKEPTKHVMVDLQTSKNKLEEWGGSILFVLEKGKARKDFSKDVFANLPKQSEFVWDLDGQLLKEIERLNKENISNDLPIIIYGDKNGKLYYFSKGYKIGIGNELEKLITE